MTPNYDAIRVAFATGNPVAARDDLIAAIQEAVEHSQHSGEAVRVIRRYLAAMDAGLSPRTINRVIDLLPAVADKYRDLKTDQLADEFFQLTLADRGVNLPETERKQ